MRTFRKIIVLLLTLSMLLSMAVVGVSAAQFSDVPNGKWYTDSILRWADAGIINGYTDGSFKPMENVTRAEFAKIIATVLGLTEQAENNFEDVPAGKWYTEPVLACVKAGIVNGYNEDGKAYFKPSNKITRQEAMKMYVAALQLSGGENISLDKFNDGSSVSNWAKGFVQTILSYGAVEGNTQNNLDPKGNITRAETAVILDRLAGIYVSKDGAISTTTAKQASKTGNIVLIHNLFDEEISVLFHAGTILVSILNTHIPTTITPSNDKTPAVLVKDEVIDVEEGTYVTITDSSITTGPIEVPKPEKPDVEPAKTITLWTYPIGGWGTPERVQEMADMFYASTGIKVNVEYLTYVDGDEKVEVSIVAGAAPDLILEGPERLVANWGAKGVMVDLSDIWNDNIYSSVTAAATAPNGSKYLYPMTMTTHCMAINKTVFEAAGAMQYIDEENHTWTTENFFKAVQAVYDAGYETVGAVYCVGQGGDQGTRALVTNLYGGAITNKDHTAYTFDNANNIKALEALKAQDGIVFDAGIAGGDEIFLFRNGRLQMAFCWNIAQQITRDKTGNGDEILFMSFPSDDGKAELQGGVWGFGVFDNGDENKIAAAKAFIEFVCKEEAVKAVEMAGYFPVSSDVTGVYKGDAIMTEYNKLSQYFGDYYQVTPGWAQARTAWWNMLQMVGEGSVSVKEAAAVWNAIANDGLN